MLAISSLVQYSVYGGGGYWEVAQKGLVLRVGLVLASIYLYFLISSLSSIITLS